MVFAMNTHFATQRKLVSQFHVSSIAILLTYGDLLQQSNLVEANYLKIVQVYHPEFTYLGTNSTKEKKS